MKRLVHYASFDEALFEIVLASSQANHINGWRFGTSSLPSNCPAIDLAETSTIFGEVLLVISLLCYLFLGYYYK